MPGKKRIFISLPLSLHETYLKHSPPYQIIFKLLFSISPSFAQSMKKKKIKKKKFLLPQSHPDANVVTLHNYYSTESAFYSRRMYFQFFYFILFASFFVFFFCSFIRFSFFAFYQKNALDWGAI